MLRLSLALLAAAALAGALPAAAQPGATRFRPDLPPPPALAAEPAAALGQVSSCAQALADPAVSVAEASSPWKLYRGARELATDQASSPPLSIKLVEAGAGDTDSVGQAFGPIQAATSEVAGAVRFRYARDSTGPGDLLRVELYETDSPGLSGLIAQRDLDVAAADDGSWQAFEWEIVDEPTLARLRGRARTALAVTTVNAANGATQQLWVDDITLNLCVPGASIGGQVRQGGLAAAGADVLLVRADAAGETVVAQASSAADGSFSFGSVPPLAAGASYRLWYVNSSTELARDDSRLGFLAGPTIASLASGASVSGLALEVGDVGLIAPAPAATVVATSAQPARLTWAARAGVPGERHRLCLYDPQRADPATRLPAQLCGPLLDPSRDTLAFSLSPASFAAAPGFGFAYGRAYRWYVVVYGGDPQADPAVPYGYSFYERSVTFAPATPAAPGPGPSLPAGDPAAGAAGADWTLLIYVAADNTLGDPARGTRLALPSSQLAALPALAAASPAVSLLSYVDDYGDRGGQLCAYPAGAAPDCRGRAEPNSAAAQSLADFISYGRARYPAARTALLIISPGSAVAGLGLDESSGGATLSFQALRGAYATGLGPGAMLDLVIYQAPNLGTVEAIDATAPYARHMVAPSDQVWQIGVLRQLVPLLAGAGRTDAGAAARGAVAAYQAAVDATIPGRMVSMAAYDLGRAPALLAAVGDLAFELNQALSTQRATMRPLLEAARDGAQIYDSSGNGRHDQLATAAGPVAASEDALVDLLGLAIRLRDTAGVPSTVRDQATAVAALLDGAATNPIGASAQRSGAGIAGAGVFFSEASGLALFFPSGALLGGQPALAQHYLFRAEAGAPRDSDWATMLRTHLAGRLGVGAGGVTAAPGGGAYALPQPGGLVKTDVSLPMLGAQR